jgi:hypothetical protein
LAAPALLVFAEFVDLLDLLALPGFAGGALFAD